MATRVTIDERQLLKEVTIGTQRNKQIVNKIMQTEVSREITESRNLLLKELTEHKVSQEIARGAGAVSTSGTLNDLRKSGKRGGGNLFSFIGFDANDKPISQLKALIRTPLNAKANTFGLGQYSIKTDMPDLETVFQKNPFPWVNLSWVEGIERGITGLGQYIFGIFGKGSRSKRGLQLKKEIRAASYTPTSYLSKMYNDFFRRLYK